MQLRRRVYTGLLSSMRAESPALVLKPLKGFSRKDPPAPLMISDKLMKLALRLLASLNRLDE